MVLFLLYVNLRFGVEQKTLYLLDALLLTVYQNFWNNLFNFPLFSGVDRICIFKFKKFTVISCGSVYNIFCLCSYKYSICYWCDFCSSPDNEMISPNILWVFFDFAIITAFYITINIAKNTKIEYNLAEAAVSLILRYSEHIAYYNITIICLINNYCNHFIWLWPLKCQYPCKWNILTVTSQTVIG